MLVERLTFTNITSHSPTNINERFFRNVSQKSRSNHEKDSKIEIKAVNLKKRTFRSVQDTVGKSDHAERQSLDNKRGASRVRHTTAARTADAVFRVHCQRLQFRIN